VDTRAGLGDEVIKGASVSNRIAIIQRVASAVAAGLLPALAERNAACHNSLYLINTFRHCKFVSVRVCTEQTQYNRRSNSVVIFITYVPP